MLCKYESAILPEITEQNKTLKKFPVKFQYQSQILFLEMRKIRIYFEQLKLFASK